MRELIKALLELAEKGEPAVLASVVADSGSTPRGAGAMMLVSNNRRVSGTVGGGAVEYEAEKTAQKVLAGKGSRTEHYMLRQNQVQDLGMICGGEVYIDFNYMEPEELAAFAQAEQEKLNEAGRVYIFGGGHVAQALVPALAAIDFRCVVLEDRQDFCRPELFPGVDATILIDNAEIAEYITVTAQDYAVIVTRGHKDDQLVQAQMLKTPARYIGVIGSRRKAASVFASLRAQGFNDGELKRITTPIGLNIGAETPAEIAVSIAAELIQVRAAANKASE